MILAMSPVIDQEPLTEDEYNRLSEENPPRGMTSRQPKHFVDRALCKETVINIRDRGRGVKLLIADEPRVNLRQWETGRITSLLRSTAYKLGVQIRVFSPKDSENTIVVGPAKPKVTKP
jgi:hypothetical protein